MITISPGNKKLGKIPNISLIPGNDCVNATHCVALCYARKAFKAYPTVSRAWKNNSRVFREANRTGNWSPVVKEIHEYLKKRKPKFFRWHVAGDFISQEHVNQAFGIARMHPDTKFLAFTKADRFDFRHAPDNFTVVASMWPGMEDKFPKKMPRAWMNDGTDARIPADVLECPGGCDTCGMCWNLRTIGKDVKFDKH